MDPEIDKPTPAAISRVLSLIKIGTPARGYIIRAIHLSDGRFVKVSSPGKRLRLEALAMEFVRKHTTIPVPKVHMVFEHNGATYLVMDNISGDTLEAAAFTMRSAALQKTAEQLRAAVDQLQTLTSNFPCPGGRVYYGQWPGTPFASNSRRFPDTAPAFSSFDDLLRYVLPSDSDVELFNKLQTRLDAQDTRPVLTHGDLGPRNIMVDEASGDILAILDWEMFGWYPAFWDRMFVLKCCGQRCLRDALQPAFAGALEEDLRGFALKVSGLIPDS